jgi:hypothetical protein
MEIKLACPEDMDAHVRAVLQGEYALPGLEDLKAPVILDIGANVGAYAVWAKAQWPDCALICFEPNPKAFVYLKENTKRMGARLEDVAVTTMARPILRNGGENMGEASLHHWVGSDGFEVRGLHPAELPLADIVKIDTEGCEAEILTHLKFKPRAICLEFHSERDRMFIDLLLSGRGYELVRGRIWHKSRGTLCYVLPEVPA